MKTLKILPAIGLSALILLAGCNNTNKEKDSSENKQETVKEPKLDIEALRAQGKYPVEIGKDYENKGVTINFKEPHIYNKGDSDFSKYGDFYQRIFDLQKEEILIHPAAKINEDEYDVKMVIEYPVTFTNNRKNVYLFKDIIKDSSTVELRNNTEQVVNPGRMVLPDRPAIVYEQFDIDKLMNTKVPEENSSAMLHYVFEQSEHTDEIMYTEAAKPEDIDDTMLLKPGESKTFHYLMAFREPYDKNQQYSLGLYVEDAFFIDYMNIWKGRIAYDQEFDGEDVPYTVLANPDDYTSYKN